VRERETEEALSPLLLLSLFAFAFVAAAFAAAAKLPRVRRASSSAPEKRARLC
jgi:hypothetical protein